MSNIQAKEAPKGPYMWHKQQMILLKKWAEIAGSYRWLHNQSYMVYKKKNLWYMIPLIIMSTLTGTANFAQSSFPEVIRPNIPQIIGAINLVSAILTTIYQFLKISEYMESHRISSINYGKLARTITTELNIPVKDRDSSGADCVKITRNEIDRLIEQSPSIPGHILVNYNKIFGKSKIEQPEIININPVDIYDDPENKVANTIADASIKFKNILKKPYTSIKKDITALNESKLVTNPPSPLKRLIGIFNTSKKQIISKSPFDVLEEVIKENGPPEPLEQLEQPEPPEKPEPLEQPEQLEQSEQPEQVQNDPESVKIQIIPDETPGIVSIQTTIQSDLETLKSSKLVSSFPKGP